MSSFPLEDSLETKDAQTSAVLLVASKPSLRDLALSLQNKRDALVDSIFESLILPHALQMLPPLIETAVQNHEISVSLYLADLVRACEDQIAEKGVKTLLLTRTQADGWARRFALHTGLDVSSSHSSVWFFSW